MNLEYFIKIYIFPGKRKELSFPISKLRSYGKSVR